MKQFFGIVLAVAMAGCASTPSGPLRMDGSSPEACQRSWKRMEASLSGQQRQELDIALLLIGSTKQHRLGALTTSPGISPETIRVEIDGKDFEEIVALGKATGTRITNVEHAK
ncbi:MAG TPA: DUF6694 family lipoprotein [Steroidobacteraceae bacterium]